MCRPRSAIARKGFTLIEVMIVIIVLAILAAIVIPRVWPTVRDARESELRANLHGMRAALALFNAHCGDYPSRLEDLLATDPTGLVGAHGNPIPAECFQGPYFITTPGDVLPRDPFTGDREWDYDPLTGAVHSLSTRTSSEGIPYSTW